MPASFSWRMRLVDNVTTGLGAFIDTIKKELGVQPLFYCECPNQYVQDILDKDHPSGSQTSRKTNPTVGMSFGKKTTSTNTMRAHKQSILIPSEGNVLPCIQKNIR